MTQLSIDFNATPPAVVHAAVAPRARRRDPVTSHDAAESMKTAAAQQAERVLKALRSLGGEAGAEQIAAACGLDAYAVRKRLPELQRLGLAAPTGVVRSTSSGRSERVWRAA